MHPLRVIIDTDPGVDDALALLLAMRSPELKVEAVTAVAGNVPLNLALQNALRMVEIAGRLDIPVAAGAERPLVRSLAKATSHGSNGLGGLEFPPPKRQAAGLPATELIRQIVGRSPGEVSLIALGPLTNVATVLNAGQSMSKQIREIVLMGGSLSGGNMTPAAEFNAYVDPEAAEIVFNSGVPVTMVGLDVTQRCLLEETHVKALEAGRDPVSRAAARIARNDFEQFRGRTSAHGRAMHDPLAVAVFIDRSLVRLQDYFIAVETEGEFTAGETVGYREAPVRKSAGHDQPTALTEPASPIFAANAKVAVEVDSARFFRMFTQRLAAT